MTTEPSGSSSSVDAIRQRFEARNNFGWTNSPLSVDQIEMLFSEIERLQGHVAQLERANSTLSGQNTELADQLREVRAELEHILDDTSRSW